MKTFRSIGACIIKSNERSEDSYIGIGVFFLLKVVNVVSTLI